MISNDELRARKYMLNSVYGKLGKESKMKPFNLEAAINGAPVVTRDGREVKQLTYFVCDSPEALAGVVGDTLRRWYNNGSYIDYIDDSPFDLFMAPQKHEGWCLIYSNGAKIFETKEKCMEYYAEILKLNNGVRVAKVEWEE